MMIGCSKSKSKESLLSILSFELQQDTSYSFSLENSSYTNHLIDIVVCVDKKSSGSRNYSLFVTEDGDATTDDYTVSGNLTIHPNDLTDTIKVVLHRNPTLKTQSRLLVLRLGSNNHFRVSDDRSLKILFDDITIIPTWWNTWEKQFGAYYKEKLVVWKEIYKQGLDKEGYYWNNMPPHAMQEYYPTTFYYIGKLKEYFDKNTIYPDGDSSLERIIIP